MKNFIAILFLVILFGCGARRSDTHIENSSGTQNLEISEQTSLNTESKGILTQNHTIVDLGYGFSIEPVNGQNSFFTLKSGNDSVQVHTNAKVNFNKNNKSENTKIIYKYFIKTTYQTHTTYLSKITYKSYLKDKSTKKEAYPWFLWFVLGMVTMALLRFLINKNTFVSMWNNLIKKR